VIVFSCPTCSKKYSVPDHHAGRRTKCRQCRGPLVVPATTDPPWVKPAAVSASDGTAERAKTPTDAEFVLPPASPDTPSPPASGEAVRVVGENGHRHTFVVELEFADDPGPVTDGQSAMYREAHEFLADVLYAYRHRLAPNGVRLKKVKVDGVEREI
jgi:DNA-directed RNA polymerase subunit RPC12/RpoP